MARYDAIVVGLGAHGSATLYALAKAGLKVLGLEAYQAPHDRGSYHGESRLIRLAYRQGADYVPLLLRARQLWQDLAEESGTSLYHQTGGLSIARRTDDSYFSEIHKAAETYHIPCHSLSAEEVNSCYPGYALPDDYGAVYDSWAGYIRSEKAVETYLARARHYGADIRYNMVVKHWQADGKGVLVQTADETFQAEKIVLTAGSGIVSLVPEYRDVWKTYRLALSWYQPANIDHFTPERFPVFVLSDGTNGCYGTPVMDDGIAGMKIGQNGLPEDVISDFPVDFTPAQKDREKTRHWTERFFNLQKASNLATKICIYTKTPDEAFILGPHPNSERVILGHACSGHGFKFAPVIGEILRDYVVGKEPAYDLALHDPLRFGR